MVSAPEGGGSVKLARGRKPVGSRVSPGERTRRGCHGPLGLALPCRPFGAETATRGLRRHDSSRVGSGPGGMIPPLVQTGGSRCRSPPPRVAVLGAGPVGLEAALAAKAAGLRRHRLRARPRRRTPPALGPRPAVHALRLERDAARPRDAPRREPQARVARRRRPPHRPRTRRRLPRTAGHVGGPDRVAAHRDDGASPSVGAGCSSPTRPGGRVGRSACSSATRRASGPRRPTPSSTAPAPTPRRAGSATAACPRPARRPPGRRSPTRSTTSPGPTAASTPASRCCWSGPASRRRRRACALGGAGGEARGDVDRVAGPRPALAAVAARPERPAARARPPGGAGQHARHARRGQRRVPRQRRRSNR